MIPTPRSDWAVFFDIDGTLLELADHPEGVTVPADLPAQLTAAQQALGGAVALVSGRTIDWIDQKFAPARLAASGQHGAEIRYAPDTPAVPIPMPRWRPLLEAALDRDLGAWPGVYVEHKPLSIAVHFRAVPQFGDEVMDHVERLGRSFDAGVEMLRGRFVIEVREAGYDKGKAVEGLMNTAVFAGRTPVFLGDDVTDEDGFRVAHALGGIAIAVGPRETRQADFHLDGPSQVRALLADIPAALERIAS